MTRTRSEAIALAEDALRICYRHRHDTEHLPPGLRPDAAIRAKRRTIRSLIQKIRAFRAA